MKALVKHTITFKDGIGREPLVRAQIVDFKRPDALMGFMLSQYAEIRKMGCLMEMNEDGRGMHITFIEDIKHMEVEMEEKAILEDTNVNAAAAQAGAAASANDKLHKGNLIEFPGRN